MHYSDYRSILKREFRIRQERNSLYSQAAFARDLGIRPNRLCEILSGKQGLSVGIGQAMAMRLKLNEFETVYFCESIREKHGRSASERESARRRLIDLMKPSSSEGQEAPMIKTAVLNEPGSVDALVKEISETLSRLPSGANVQIQLSLGRVT